MSEQENQVDAKPDGRTLHVLGDNCDLPEIGIARRRLVRAGFAAAPVVLALSGRSAMADAANCGAKGLSPMAWNSLSPGDDGKCGTLSHTVGRNTLGRSPGLWKPNTGGKADTFQVPWPSNAVSGAVTPFAGYIYNGSYKGIASSDARWATGTTFNSVFTDGYDFSIFVGVVGDGNTSISKLLINTNNASPLAIKLACAYLNAKTFPGYAMTVAQVFYLAVNKRLVPGGPLLSDSTIRDFLDQTWS